MKNNTWNKCDNCGTYIPMADFEQEKAIRKFILPDSDYSTEEYETLCKKCTTKERYLETLK